MKRILLIAFLFALAACQSGQDKEQDSPVAEASAAAEWQHFGAAVNQQEVVAAYKLTDMAAKEDSLLLTVKGEALSSCSKKGCWMKVKLAEGEEMRVTFKDYGFFVPKDLTGEEVIFEGMLTHKMIDVETLQHYVQDAGASEEEVKQITDPKKEYSFEATGVLVKR
jgi:starvation-inducible outer membrane lipoprotein